MVAESNSLTALKVARIKEPGRYGDGGGLYLRVAEYRLKDGTLARSKNWLFRFERNGRERWMGLGPLKTLSLAEARAKAWDCRKALLDSIDPIEVRRAAKQKLKLDAARSITFKAMCRKIYQRTPQRLEERQARRAMAGNADAIRLSDHWRLARRIDRHRTGDKMHRADLDRKA